ncbi:MAG: phosphate/phosphite/phosphonate ABC transporter substrate-binding protein, partial [Elusimicrobiota bacterium]
IAIFSFFIIGCFRNEKNIGSDKDPVILALSKPYFENLSQEEIKKFEDGLKRYSGLNVIVQTVGDSVEIIEKIGSKKADVVFLTINEYLIGREEYRVMPVLQLIRRKTEKEYYGVIASINKDIKNLNDINGKKFGSRNVYSISSFVLPSILFVKGGINPEFVFSDSYEESYKMIKEGKIDAAGFYKHFTINHKDLNVIYEIGPIPNEPVVCRKDLKSEICERIKTTLLSMSKDKDFSDIFKKMADIEGFSETDVKRYAEIHNTVKNYSKGIYSLIPDGIKIRKLNEDYNFN